MHENHRRPLLKARNDFRKARNKVNAEIRSMNHWRGVYVYRLNRGWDTAWHFANLKGANTRVIEAIEAYRATAEILEIVEYALRRA